MFLKRFVYVNWGNIPNLEFDFGPINLFSGGNGSGKTTAADAIQTIMTAAHENLFQFNPGQDETTQRGKGGKKVRTLASYVLGCDDGSFARLEPTDGYLAAVFHPTQGESAEPFTALIGARAFLESNGNQSTARQEQALFMILPGQQLGLAHLQREDVGGKYVVPLDQVYSLLVAEFGKSRVEKYDTKKGYLKRLYGVLRGRDESVTEMEAINAARAFSRFMAYKPVQGINKFVADEILEKRDLGDAIRSISGQLKLIHGMERDANQLIASIQTLESAKQQGQLYIESWIQLNSLDYSLARHRCSARQKEYLAAKTDQKQCRQQLSENEQETSAIGDRRTKVRDQLISLQAQRLGIESLQRKDELELKREREQKRLGEGAQHLLQQDQVLKRNLELTSRIGQLLREPAMVTELPMVADLQSQALCRQVLDGGNGEEIDFHTLMGKDMLGDLEPLERYQEQAMNLQHLHNHWRDHWLGGQEGNGGASLYDQCSRLNHQREQRHEQLASQCRGKQLEIERLEGQQVTYPPYVERALQAIRQQCPQADPRVLCDHIEVKDERWQAAIEGYLGGARFSILVDPAYEAEAIRIVRRMADRQNKARIIQGDKARQDAERLSLPGDSIVHVLEFSHASARHFLTASYGSVQRVESAEELRHTRRGITADGMGAGNYSMWRCDLPDSELVFGVAARQRALQAKQQELEELTAEWQQARDRWQSARQLKQAVDGLQSLSYGNAIVGLLDIQRELQKLDNLIARLDLTEHRELEEQLSQLKEKELQLQTQEGQLKEAKGQLQERLRKLDEACTHLASQKEQAEALLESSETHLRAIAQVWSDWDMEKHLAFANEEAESLNVQQAENSRLEVEKALHQSERRMDSAIISYNQTARPGDAVLYQAFEGDYDAALFQSVCGLQRELDRVYNRLKNNILVEKHQELSKLKESFNNAFVTNLCHSIYQSINDGKRQIDVLNKELQHHRFGADRETYRFDSDWLPEYREYARFFEEVIKNPNLGDGATLFEITLSKKSTQVRDQLMEMLLEEDEHKALRELERIADYRNYRRYEIYKEVEGKPPIPLSEYGTGSGGQLETPAYIIRAAAITSAFRFAEGANHLRMVLVDEAFSKMDETRSREVINYLTQALGLQLLFIMPTSKSGPYMDLISNEFVFAKTPSARPRGQLKTRVLVDRKQCNQEKIRDLWANHRKTIYEQADLDFMKEVIG